MTWFKMSIRLDKGQHRNCLRFWCWEYLCNVTTWCMQLLRTYHVHKTTWLWASLKVHKGHTKVNVKLIRDFDVENISINLQHDKAIYEMLSCSQGCRHFPPLVTCPPRQWQYPSSLRVWGVKRCHVFKHRGISSCVEAQELMRFHQDGGPALIVMKGHKPPWIMYDLKIVFMRYIYGTVQKSLLGVENFSGAPILPFNGQRDFANPLNDAKI